MKKLLKALLIFIALIVVGFITFWVYLFFVKVDRIQPLQAVSQDAVMVIETENLTKGWREVKESALWDRMLEGNYLEEYEADMMNFDSLMAENPLVRQVFQNRPLAVSFQMTSESNYEILFAVDIGKYGKLAVLPKLAGMFNFDLTTRQVDSVDVHALTYGKPNEVIHLAIKENLLVGSLAPKLVDQCIETLKSGESFSVDKFTEVQQHNGDGMVKFYLNFNLLDNFAGAFSPELKESLKSVSEVMAYSALVANLEDKNIELVGYSNHHDSVPSLVDALVKADPGEMEAHHILPSKTAVLMDINIDDFDRFYNDFMQQYKTVDPHAFEEYHKGLRMSEKWLGVNFDSLLFSWLEGEFAMAKLRPESNARELDVLFAIKANDIDLARDNMSVLLKHIKKRTPVKFDQIDYRNHQIYLLNMKGFFKLFVGQLMNGMEKPYFTFLDDYIVFSNSVNSLMGMVDDYLVGNTLARNPGFSDFMKQFGNEGNLSVFVQMPKVYQHLYYYSDRETRKDLKRNRDLLVNFSNIGWQLKATGDLFETVLLAHHDENTLLYEELEEMQKSAEELYVEEFRELKFKIDTGEYFPYGEGHIDYWASHPERVQDSIIIHEGEMRDSLVQDLWRSYYPSGNIKSAVTYDDGLVDGTAIFYYDDKPHTVRAEVVFDDDVLDGDYKEFYSNSRLKAQLTTDGGLFDGDATYYYRNGQVKIEGRYKNGLRHGKWKHFTKAGELLNKESWRNGVE
ncbi:MAG: DUF3352 domain-containing protein [Marinilabiliaceae bacterium]|nr:DUF3352 domain-containing protein [Marinilabiliaceae bacterium]